MENYILKKMAPTVVISVLLQNRKEGKAQKDFLIMEHTYIHTHRIYIYIYISGGCKFGHTYPHKERMKILKNVTRDRRGALFLNKKNTIPSLDSLLKSSTNSNSS